MTEAKLVVENQKTDMEVAVDKTMKVSRQVIKATLQKELRESNEKVDKLVRIAQDTFCGYEFLKKIEPYLWLYVAQDDFITKCRELANEFHALTFDEHDEDEEYRQYHCNKDFIASNDLASTVNRVFSYLGHYNSRTVRYIPKKISVTLEMGVYFAEIKSNSTPNIDNPQDLEITIEFEKCEKLQGLCALIDTYNANMKNLYTAVEAHKIISDKVANMDEHLEEIEAALIMKELNKSTEGSATLSVAENIIKSVLGDDTPKLLEK